MTTNSRLLESNGETRQNGHNVYRETPEDRMELRGEAALSQQSIRVTGNGVSLEDNGVSLAAMLEIPFVHKGLIAKSVILSVLAAWVVLIAWPRSFESEAKLVVKVGRESVALEPTASTSQQTLMLQKTQEEEINSALEVLSSRQVAEYVVDQLGPEPILEGVLPGSSSGPEPSFLKESFQLCKSQVVNGIDTALLWSGIRDPISSREKAIRRVGSSLRISAPKKSTVVTIHAEAKTPAMAQALAQAVTDGFLEQHMKVSNTEGSQLFFDQQSQDNEAKLTDLLDQRSRLMQDSKIVSIDENRKLLAEQLGAVTKDLLTVQGELEQARAEIQDLVVRVEEAPEEIVANKARESDQTWSGIRQRVYELEALEKKFAASYTDNNSKLVRLREELQGARSILAKMDSERVNQSTTPNPQRLRLQEELQKLQTKVIGLEKVAAVKQEQRATIHKGIDALIDFELNLAELNRNISLLEGNLQTLRQKQEESRVIDELQRDRISNISSFQPATFVERPISPNKPLIAVGLPMLGLCCGFGLALLREFGNTKLRTGTHIEQKLGTRMVARVERNPRLLRLERFVNATDSDLLRQECKSIVSEILLARGGRGTEGLGQSIGVVGVDEGCGASTLAAALAITSAEECGLRTTLIDADLKSQSIASAFSLNGEPGLSELLCGVANHKECVQAVNRQGLDVISGCSPNSTKNLVLEPQAIQATLRELCHNNDLVVFDLPPASRPDQAIALAQHLDFVVVVVEAERTEEQQAKRVIRRLEASPAEVMGVVLNKAKTHLPRWIGCLVS